MKKTILHIIDNLGRGGAETMLVATIRHLSEYNNIIVTLYPLNEFEEELQCDQLICLNMTSHLMVPKAAIQLNRLIKKNKVAIVHSHLFWSSLVARLGVPRSIPLVTTIHAFVASSVEYKHWYMRLIERVSYQYRKKNIIVAVAKGALEEYFQLIKIKPYKTYVLYTFADTRIFNEDTIQPKNVSENFRLVSVGNLKDQKNHHFLTAAFKEIKNENISLAIYGKGPLQEALQKEIDENQLKITLMGQVKNIEQEIGRYNLFVMSSFYEGFALSVLEAMAVGMPLLLSSIPSFKEQCEDTAVYFNLSDTNNFVSKLIALKNNPQLLQTMGAAAKTRMLKNYTLDKHMQQLKVIYSDALK